MVEKNNIFSQRTLVRDRFWKNSTPVLRNSRLRVVLIASNESSNYCNTNVACHKVGYCLHNSNYCIHWTIQSSLIVIADFLVYMVLLVSHHSKQGWPLVKREMIDNFSWAILLGDKTKIMMTNQNNYLVFRPESTYISYPF